MASPVLQRDNVALIALFIWLSLLAGLHSACSPERKSATYYHENKDQINQLRQQYEVLYRQQPFSAGFTDKTCTYYVMQIATDTARIIYNSEKGKNELWENIIRFQYDTVQLKTMADWMKKIKCLWIGKAEHYFGDKRELFTYISFQSADKLFRENKYYILVFPDRKMNYPELHEQVAKGRLKQIDSLVYYGTANKYR